MKAQRKIWMDGKFVDWGNAKIHVLTHGLHYGMSIFEGIRAFQTSRGAAIFRLKEHMERFFNSAKIYRMELGFSQKSRTPAWSWSGSTRPKSVTSDRSHSPGTARWG